MGFFGVEKKPGNEMASADLAFFRFANTSLININVHQNTLGHEDE